MEIITGKERRANGDPSAVGRKAGKPGERWELEETERRVWTEALLVENLAPQQQVSVP